MCPECGNEELSMIVTLGVKAPFPEFFRNLSKTQIRSKEVQVLWADWPDMSLVCECGWMELGPQHSRKVQTALRTCQKYIDQQIKVYGAGEDALDERTLGDLQAEVDDAIITLQDVG